MGRLTSISIKTSGEKFYSITDRIKKELSLINPDQESGVLTLYLPHTSCALCINEDFEPSAKADMEHFLKHLAPNSLNFIKHTDEGADDSPSHMKSILLQTSLSLIIERGLIIMGQWQGIFLCEFRSGEKDRQIYLKFQADH